MPRIYIRIDGQPMRILLKGKQRDGIPVLVVKPAPQKDPAEQTSASQTKGTNP